MRLLSFGIFAVSTALVTAASAQNISTTGAAPPRGDSVLTGALVSAGTNQKGALAVSGNTGQQSPVPVQAGRSAGGNRVLRNQSATRVAVYGAGVKNPNAGNTVVAGAQADAAGKQVNRFATVQPR
jgi:hypothetical protein